MNAFGSALLLACITTPAAWFQYTQAEANAARAAAQKVWVALVAAQAIADANLKSPNPVQSAKGIERKVFDSMTDADKEEHFNLQRKVGQQHVNAHNYFGTGNNQTSTGEDWRLLGDAAYMAFNWLDAVSYYSKARDAYASAVESYKASNQSFHLSSEAAAKRDALLAKYRK
jgi:hypothetical protein